MGDGPVPSSTSGTAAGHRTSWRSSLSARPPNSDPSRLSSVCTGHVQPESSTRYSTPGAVVLWRRITFPNLLISTALLSVSKGTVNVPVVNVGQEDQRVRPRTVQGTLHLVDVNSSPQIVQVKEQAQDQGRCVAFSYSVTAEPSSSPTIPGLNELNWPDLSSQETSAAKSLLCKYSDAFSLFDGDVGCANVIQHEIPLMDDIPVRQRYRRLPPSQFSLVKTHIQELLQQGIVRASCSPYASPIVVVQKKGGDIRLCVDYRQLNAKTRKDAYPLPRIEESLDALSGAKWFSTLDTLASGYNQVPMAERDKEKTAFCTPFGLFEFNRMPFGLCNAPGTFQRLMEWIFGDQSFQSLLLYLDDIVIFSTTFSQHLERLEMVLERLRQHFSEIKNVKMSFFSERSQIPGPCHLCRGSGYRSREGQGSKGVEATLHSH